MSTERDLAVEALSSAKSAHHRVDELKNELREDIAALRAEVRAIPEQVATRWNGLVGQVHDLARSHAALEAKCIAIHTATPKTSSAEIRVAKINRASAIRVALITAAGSVLVGIGALLATWLR